MSDLDELTRRLMEEINACTPGATLAEVPTLFAFGPIYRALEEVRQPRSDHAALIERLRELREAHRDGMMSSDCAGVNSGECETCDVLRDAAAALSETQET